MSYSYLQDMNDAREDVSSYAAHLRAIEGLGGATLEDQEQEDQAGTIPADVFIRQGRSQSIFDLEAEAA